MSSVVCKNCDGTEVDVDPTRGDAVCTACGTVIEASTLVDEIQFEHSTRRGGCRPTGQFVPSHSEGGATEYGGTGWFRRHCGVQGTERTLRKARKAVNFMANHLNLNGKLVDIAFNFYKLALMHNFTRGRKHPHLIAACVYLTCRTESTAHLLIDCSDALQTNAYALGRTYLKLSQALHIRVPTMDPCLYVLRFANRLEFGDKTHEVAMTALRLVQRMKKDSIHTGRRPSGLCGAALLMAARMHDFSRSVEDVVKVVRVHQTTVRKRLLEFGETPSSSLTLDEFMTVDLDEEQDAPSFKAARLKEQEKLRKVIDSEITPKSLTDLQEKIEMELDKNKFTSGKNSTYGEPETSEAQRFVEESVVNVVEECLDAVAEPDEPVMGREAVGLGPNAESLNLVTSLDDAWEWTGGTGADEPPATYLSQAQLIDGIDDEEIDSYIMSTTEAGNKTQLWNKVNANYLEAQREKEKRAEKETEEGKTEKKIKKTYPKKPKNVLYANSAGEAINKMWASISGAMDSEEDSDPDDPEISLRQILCGCGDDFPDDYAGFADDY